MKTHSFKTALAWREADGRSSLGHGVRERHCEGSRGIMLNPLCLGGKYLLFIGA